MQGDEVDQIYLDLEQRHFSLKREHDAVCYERDAIKGTYYVITLPNEMKYSN